MTVGRATPIVVGVGDVKNRSQNLEDAIEPMQLMLQAIQHAVKDTNLSPSATAELQSKIDSIDVVATWTWPYPDLPGLISKRLGIEPSHKHYSPHGGNQPARLFDDAARRISLGKSKVAVVTGGEALASRMYHLRILCEQMTLRTEPAVSERLCSGWETASSWLDRTGSKR
jgi:hypothetical protein